MQKGQPIALESRKISTVEQNFNVYEKEMLAIIHALEKFKQYLVCGSFTIRSDHNSLKYFLSQTDLSDKQQRWVRRLQSFYFEIHYIIGKKHSNQCVVKEPLFSLSLSTITADCKKTIMDEYAKDKFLFGILNGRIRNKKHEVKEGLILRRNRILMVPN